jgi:hypothetical protein
MTQSNRQAATLGVLMLALFALVATDTHKTIIAAAWPYLLAFAEYQAK